MLPLLIVLAIVLAWLAWTWNRLVALRAALRGAWASVEVLLKRRADLVPQLVTVVRGTMDYEADTLKRVTETRTNAVAAHDIADRARAEEAFAGSVRQLVALVESYPALQANRSALEFQKQLAETEDEIAMSRRYYNAVVRDYNTLRETFPTFLVANAFGFDVGPYFELERASESEAPTVRLERGS